MPMAVRTGVIVAAAGVAGLVGTALGLPPYTVNRLYKSGDLIGDFGQELGQINNPFFGGTRGGSGFFGGAINNSGNSYILAGIYADPGFNRAVLNPAMGIIPYIAAGVKEPLPMQPPRDGWLPVPTGGYVYNDSYFAAMNNAGRLGLTIRLTPGSGSPVTPTTGVYFDKTAMPIREGEAVTAAGVAPGTVFAAFDGTNSVQLNDNNVYLVGAKIIESGQTRNALLKVTVNASGVVQSQQLVAKEAGPVGAGPATWTVLSIAPNTCAINNVGDVIFSGTTSTGVDGIYKNGQFVAVSGGPAPGGNIWRPLTGSSVDINSSGQFAFRGNVEGNGQWPESGDAGEAFSSSFTFTANSTLGGGYLRTIAGSLANDHDIDLYMISVGDPSLPTQETFSATTVPNPGAGFAGASFDTVLYLFRPDGNGNGNTRVCLGRCDDASAGVVQSTLTTASLPPTHTPGAKYFLGIATPKVRAQAGFQPPYGDMWQSDPGRLAVMGGVVYWVEPSEGQIRRASTSTGALLSPLQIATIPQQTTGGQSTTNDAPCLSDRIAVYNAGVNSKIYCFVRAFGGTKIFRCNTDGSGVEDVIASGSPGPNGTTAMAVDSVNGVLYWSQPLYDTQTFTPYTQINSSALDGTNRQAFVILPTQDRISDITVDTFGTGKVYWSNTTADSIQRADLTGMNVETVLSSAGATSLAIDVSGRKLYYASRSGNRVGVLNLATGAPLADLAATTEPEAAAFDPADGRVYWSNPMERRIRRSPAAAPAVENWLYIGPEVGDRPGDGEQYLEFFKAWAKSGTASGGSLPYQIKLTGATFASPLAVITRNNTVKVVQTGEAPVSTGGQTLTVVGAVNSPIRISDRGLVAWRGRWVSGGTRTGLFLNTDLLVDDATVPLEGGLALGAVGAEAGAFDMSGNGQYLIANSFNGAFVGGGNNCFKIAFSSVPGCAADFNNSGAVTVQDIFDFLAAWFTANPSADFNNSGAVTVQDIFDFLAAWFLGCTT